MRGPHTTMPGLFAALAILLLIAACARQGPTNQTNATTPAPGQGQQPAPGTPANPGGPAQGELQQCQQTISYETLMGALPASLSGYTLSGKPDGTTLTWTDPANPQQQVRYSTASETFTSGEKTLVASVLDTCYVQYLSEGWSRFVEYQGTEGFMKKTTIKGYPAWEQYDKTSDTYSLNVLVQNRVFATVQGSQGVSEADVIAAANSIDYDKIIKAT